MKLRNEDIDLLPLTQFDKEIVIVDTDEALAKAMEELRTVTLLGFDTETRPSFTRSVSYQVALLQLSTEERTWLFRLCKIGMPQELADLMSNPQVCKVGLAIRDDLRALCKRRQFTPANCIDLQTIAKSKGVEEMSLKKMAAQLLGIRVSKRQRLSNWENSSLTIPQQLYAATDSWVSLLMFNAFQQGVLIHPRLQSILSAEQA